MPLLSSSHKRWAVLGVVWFRWFWVASSMLGLLWRDGIVWSLACLVARVRVETPKKPKLEKSA